MGGRMRPPSSALVRSLPDALMTLRVSGRSFGATPCAISSAAHPGSVGAMGGHTLGCGLSVVRMVPRPRLGRMSAVSSVWLVCSPWYQRCAPHPLPTIRPWFIHTPQHENPCCQARAHDIGAPPCVLLPYTYTFVSWTAPHPTLRRLNVLLDLFLCTNRCCFASPTPLPQPQRAVSHRQALVTSTRHSSSRTHAVFQLRWCNPAAQAAPLTPTGPLPSSACLSPSEAAHPAAADPSRPQAPTAPHPGHPVVPAAPMRRPMSAPPLGGAATAARSLIPRVAQRDAGSSRPGVRRSVVGGLAGAGTPAAASAGAGLTSSLLAGSVGGGGPVCTLTLVDPCSPCPLLPQKVG